METYLFYAYLKYAKESKQHFWPKLLSKPIGVIIFFSLTLLSCIGGAVSSFLGWDIAALIFIAGEIIFGIAFFYRLEKFHICFCVEEYEKYKKYCFNLRKWLKQFDQHSDTDIQELHGRIQANITRLRAEYESEKARGDRWLQTLIIPMVIAIITAIITKQESIESMFAYSFVIVALFVVIYGAISVIKSISSFPQKRTIEQMECFSSDLQSILDLADNK
jgi:hypothetical protein